MTSDALVLAGDAAAELERHGVVACGRRIDGVTHLDVWTEDGRAFKLQVSGSESVDDLVKKCLSVATTRRAPRRTPSTLS